MITFKQFLSDAVVTPWEVSPLTVTKAIDYLNEHATDGLKAISNGGLIYRGFQSTIIGGSKTGFSVIDSSTGERTSRDTSNLYQLMMDISPALTEFPKRSKSFICSTSVFTVGNYGREMVIVPHNGTTVAVLDEPDIFRQVILDPACRISISTFDDKIGNFIVGAGSQVDFRSGGKFTEYQSINEALSKFTPSELSVLWAKTVLPTGLRFNKKDDADNIAYAFQYFQVTDLLDRPDRLEMLKRIAEFIEKNPKVMDAGIKRIYDLFEKSPSHSRFESLSGFLMNPENMSMKLHKYGAKLKTNSECWFSGKAMVIPFKVFGKILGQLQKSGHPIDPVVFDDWNTMYPKIIK
jgi:hypothetical protein